MVAIRAFSHGLRPLASTSTASFSRSALRSSSASLSRALQQRRGLATEADAPAPMVGFKQTTVEELHSQSAHEALAGTWLAP